MADHETTVRVKGDPSGLKAIERANKEAFSPEAAKQMKRAAKDLEQELQSLTRRQIGLLHEMKNIEKGTDAYKKLRDELKGVREEVGLYETALRGVAREMREFDRQAKQAARQAEQETTARFQRAQSFAGGLAQGAGIAQYIPTGPGMGSRIAGGVVGGAFRRAAGGAAGAFQPGLGGLQQMLGAIPLIGGIASGALQSAAGMYQETVGFDRARLENLPYVDAMGGILRKRRRVSAAETAVETARQQAVDKEISRVGNLYLDFEQGEDGRLKQTAKSQKLLKLSDINVRAGTQDARNALKKAQESAAVPGLFTAGAGADLGFTAEQAQGIFGSFMGARGGWGGGKAGAREAMVFQRLFGIQAGTAGQFARSYEAGGGGDAQARTTLTEVMGSAFERGLRGSQVAEYLQSLVQLTQQAEQQGVKLNIESMLQSTEMLTAVGLRGPQAGRVFGAFQGAAQQTGFGGIRGPQDVLMLRAFGYDPSQGLEGFARARFAAQKGFGGPGGAARLRTLVGNLVGGAGAMGGGNETVTSFFLQQALGGLNVRVGEEQARDMLRAVRGGGMVAGGGARPGLEFWEDIAKQTTGAVGGTAVQEASLQAERIAAGRGFAGVMKTAQKSTIEMVDALGNFEGALKTLAKFTESFAVKLQEITTGDWWGRLRDNIFGK